MNILAMDTSNHVLGVALLKDDQLIGEVTTNLKKNHSVRLMPAIDQLMRAVDMTPQQLDRIVVAKGPGSYTGVRIGLTTAKSMAWALDIPVVGVSSLEVLAWQGRFYNAYICPFFDARRGLVYTGLYQMQHNHLELVSGEKNVLMEDWLKELAHTQKEVLFLSPDIHLHQEMIHTHLGDRAIMPDGPFQLASPSHLAYAGSDKRPDSTHTLVPNYLRLAEAEANWLREGTREK
ncbi:tRNA (adenosine(37)-N6)-threonylcarbamoyltransferase complex dimerization subunit type 1 TsaB [Lentibacillus sp. CBA3610]|uniref:tRNA (adenosine(37)-N6)-threonylcarbamoyltransferase complex dimerization subunit type 1 TsaB n=1 Tax=Lentibacillus sp. CBA3610 TaxID=2518176 RepID=UPI001595879D|nr:tRNA (adenosine(37)-N6)-threonylcarbamoyltransferase complex dimerization subunit type 1 TsaB [Lentibacillus sp. CBA3610]QKY71224.1 tRNA (adenosine(37)-N6)-threonylcarbamoyltransferase complex dimerization subunit type 1 TsaB [Lentibacillus sp. CBA3610]